MVVPVVSHCGAVLGLLIISLAFLMSVGCKAVRYLIPKFWTWSIPGAFQLASFLVVAVSCSVVKSVHLSFLIGVISFFSSSNQVASMLWVPLLFQRFPQKVVMSSFNGGLEMVVDFLLGVCNVVKKAFLLLWYSLLFFFLLLVSFSVLFFLRKLLVSFSVCVGQSQQCCS